MKPKLTSIWIDDRRKEDDVLSIRAEFDNYRRYEYRIARPYDNNALAAALHGMAVMIGSDPKLRE